jgi:dipeptidyl aminopeptidase/acylaminoacyl peptidase
MIVLVALSRRFRSFRLPWRTATTDPDPLVRPHLHFIPEPKAPVSRLKICLLIVMAVWAAASTSAAQESPARRTGANGEIVARAPCAPMRPYAAERLALQQAGAPAVDSVEYARLARLSVCERITYWSDGLRVVALLVRPPDTARSIPFVVFNHGSTAARGALPERVTAWQARLVDRGYAVLAPQYRGGGGGEGRDEFGGADVHDVLNVFPVAAALGYLDMRNAFMHGHSRGGTMTYLALKAGAPVRAAAASAAVADFAARSAFTPWVRDSVDRVLMPDFERREVEHYRERSAVHWPERLSVPLLIVHGTADDRVPPLSALELAMRLQRLGRRYELVMFAGGNHDLTAHRPEFERRLADWFDSHRVR